ncbi:MAG: GNAT family N-acetyltransferase [Chloroflexi bacterium]|nr:GNAT family N-acetyltransferase [Chloroflexota bacterium]
MQSKNVVLRDVLEADLPTFYEHQLDTEAAQMAEFPSRDWASFMAHWKKVMSDPSNILKTILVDGQVAGNIVSWAQAGEREIGYWLGRECWGKGIATAALTEFLALVKTRPLYGYIAKHNAASRRVLEKCGFAVCREDREEIVLVLGAN